MTGKLISATKPPAATHLQFPAIPPPSSAASVPPSLPSPSCSRQIYLKWNALWYDELAHFAVAIVTLHSNGSRSSSTPIPPPPKSQGDFTPPVPQGRRGETF